MNWIVKMLSICIIIGIIDLIFIKYSPNTRRWIVANGIALAVLCVCILGVLASLVIGIIVL